jgi:hypothetical protein
VTSARATSNPWPGANLDISWRGSVLAGVIRSNNSEEAALSRTRNDDTPPLEGPLGDRYETRVTRGLPSREDADLLIAIRQITETAECARRGPRPLVASDSEKCDGRNRDGRNCDEPAHVSSSHIDGCGRDLCESTSQTGRGCIRNQRCEVAFHVSWRGFVLACVIRSNNPDELAGRRRKDHDALPLEWTLHDGDEARATRHLSTGDDADLLISVRQITETGEHPRYVSRIPVTPDRDEHNGCGNYKPSHPDST